MEKREKLSPKVEALYKAVMELILEGREIRKMKVSEITERAGIGKGTAYEYFASREDLLINALNYFQEAWTESVLKEVSRYSGFMGKTGCLFDLLDSILKKIKREALEEICNIFLFSPIFKRDGGGMQERLYGIVEAGRRGGELKEELPDEYIVLALSGKIFNYISYCVGEKDDVRSTCTSVQIRELLLDSICMEFLKKERPAQKDGKC